MNQRSHILSLGNFQYQDCSKYQVNDEKSRGGNGGYTCRASWTHEKWQPLSSNPVSPFPSSTGCQTQECRTNSLSFPELTHLHPFIWTADWKELQPSTGSWGHQALFSGLWLLTLPGTEPPSLPVWTLSRAATLTIKTTVIRQICFGTGLR